MKYTDVTSYIRSRIRWERLIHHASLFELACVFLRASERLKSIATHLRLPPDWFTAKFLRRGKVRRERAPPEESNTYSPASLSEKVGRVEVGPSS